MWIADQWKDYELLDCSLGEKLERWGGYTLVRPDPQAIWDTPRSHRGWDKPDARYARSRTGGGQWASKKVPERWQVRYRDLTFQVGLMNFKHTGLFPEQAANWDFARDLIQKAGRPVSVLNLFAYTGGATVACAAAGASVCHVDAAKGMVQWARDNARLSGLEELEQAIRSALPRQTGEEAYGELLTNARQEEAASRALERLEGAQAGLSAGVTPDALLTDVEEALSALGELTGASVREDITDRIFQRFCVGK